MHHVFHAYVSGFSDSLYGKLKIFTNLSNLRLSVKLFSYINIRASKFLPFNDVSNFKKKIL